MSIFWTLSLVGLGFILALLASILRDEAKKATPYDQGPRDEFPPIRRFK